MLYSQSVAQNVDNIECVFLYLVNDSCSIRLFVSWVLVME